MLLCCEFNKKQFLFLSLDVIIDTMDKKSGISREP